MFYKLFTILSWFDWTIAIRFMFTDIIFGRGKSMPIYYNPEDPELVYYTLKDYGIKSWSYVYDLNGGVLHVREEDYEEATWIISQLGYTEARRLPTGFRGFIANVFLAITRLMLYGIALATITFLLYLYSIS
jgi:hypothetical protein